MGAVIHQAINKGHPDLLIRVLFSVSLVGIQKSLPMVDNYIAKMYLTEGWCLYMSKKEYWGKWFKAAGIRAIKTVAQAAVALIGTNAFGITDVDWIAVASAAALAGVVSLLTSVAGLPEVPEEGE